MEISKETNQGIMKPMPLRLFLKMSAMLGLMASPVLKLFENRKQYITSCPADEMVGLMIEFSETRPPTVWKTVEIVERCGSPMKWKGEWISNYYLAIYRAKSRTSDEQVYFYFLSGKNDEVDFSKHEEIRAYRLT